MSELDTITDFTAYLDRKSEFVRSGKLAVAESEEDLVAYYAVRINEYGDHDFTHPDERPWSEGERIAISKTFINFIQNPQYTAKKRADEISYVWDELIKKFSGHMLDGTSLVPDGHSYDLKQSETALRYMAKENRFQRRIHGQAVVGAINIGRSAEHFFFRSMIGAPGSKGNETGFFVLVFPYLDWMEDQGGYQHYRKKRAEIAVTYGEAMLLQCSHLKRMVGVSLEPPSKDRGSSEDLLQIEQRDWTPEEQREIKDACKAMGIAQNFTENQISDQEFPELEYAPDATKQRELGPNRKERRKAKAQSLKRNQKKR
ncbi:hypothetical protein HJO_13136 [Hyphomonas johnsonii MHS-2]|uniref:Uncharacterized protein n=2 Tax=Hyphomonas johnsonii TaxID=81031 RepID=A0A059FJK9_9PROT|nr:hypothetical protein HJO_13136 [Hyphomonas johnsonii MHS-2]